MPGWWTPLTSGLGRTAGTDALLAGGRSAGAGAILGLAGGAVTSRMLGCMSTKTRRRRGGNRKRARSKNRRLRQWSNQIGELHADIRRLRAENGRRAFLWQLPGIIMTVVAGWMFRPQPPQEPQPFTLGKSRLGGADTLG